MRDPRERLRDVLEAIERIDRYTSQGREKFDRDELVQSWVVRHLQIIGEALRSVPEEVRILAPEIPWRKIVGARHILVHDYFGIDLDVVWNVVERELPELRRQIGLLLSRLESSQ